MSRSNNFRISLNLSNFFNDHRHRARIFVGDKIQTVKNLQDKISNLFGIENFHLSAQNQFLPPSEDVRILQQDEILWATPMKSDEYIVKQPQSDIANKLKKHKTKSKAKLKYDEQSSEDLWIPTKRKKSGEVQEQINNVSNIKKKYKVGEPSVSSEINGNDTIDTNEVVIDEELDKQSQKKSKKKKKHKKLEDIEMEVIEDINTQNISNKKSHSVEDIGNQNKSIDESFKRNKLLYTKNSPLPTITGQYLKHKKVNIVKIDYVNLKPSTSTSEDKQDGEEIMENETTANQKEERLLDTNEIKLPTKTIPSIMCSNDDEIRINGDGSKNKMSEGKYSTSNIEPVKDYLETVAPVEVINEMVVKPTSEEAIPAQATNSKFDHDPKRNDSNLRIQKENYVGKQKFFFFNSPSLDVSGRPVPLSRKTAPISFDENGKLLPKLFKHPASYTETKSVSCTETKSAQESDKKTNDWKDKDHLNGIREIASTSTPLNESAKEPVNVEERVSDQNSQAPALSVHNESTTNIVSENSYEYSGVSLNETVLLSRDDQNSFGISGIQRISPREPSSKYQISGIGPLLEGLRKAESSRASSPTLDCSEFVTLRRKRVRKRRKTPPTPAPPYTPPPATPPRPMNVRGAPSMHIKFDEEGEAVERVGKVSQDEEEVVGGDSPQGEVRTSVQDILRAPSMSSMKPRVGDIIAFKILKIGPSYQPELSSHITGKVAEYHIDDNQVILDIIGGVDQCKEPEGKFSMRQDENENSKFESRRREYSWPDLIEPRLLYP